VSLQQILQSRLRWFIASAAAVGINNEIPGSKTKLLCPTTFVAIPHKGISSGKAHKTSRICYSKEAFDSSIS
jgi:hypothetical protein